MDGAPVGASLRCASSFTAAEIIGGITLCLLDDIGNRRAARVAKETGRYEEIFRPICLPFLKFVQRRPPGTALRRAAGR